MRESRGEDGNPMGAGRSLLSPRSSLLGEALSTASVLWGPLGRGLSCNRTRRDRDRRNRRGPRGRGGNRHRGPSR